MIKRVAAVLLAVLTLALSLFACGENKLERKISSMSIEELEACMTVAPYKGVTFECEGKDKETVINEYLMKESKLIKLPEGDDSVEYYITQLKEEYKYHAEKAGISYDELLSELGIEEEDIVLEATELVEKDIIFTVIQKKENITLSDSDKEKHFDKYVDKYAERYGYDKEHVRENLKDEVYSTMLYDKTMEFLILNNKFE